MRRSTWVILSVLLCAVLLAQEQKRAMPGDELEKRIAATHLTIRGAAACGAAGTIRLGQTISGTLAYGDCSSYDPTYGTFYVDFYSFSPTAGHTYTVTTHSSMMYLATIQDSSAGDVLASSGSCGMTQDNCSFSWTAPSGNPYFVGMGSFGTGSYTLLVADTTGPAPTPLPTAVPTPRAGGCYPDNFTHCLSAGRYEVKATYNTGGSWVSATAVPMTTDTGYFWFFNNSNVELVIKVLDARAINGRVWVFYGALSNVWYKITVKDTVTGQIRTYENPEGTMASFADTAAF